MRDSHAFHCLSSPDGIASTTRNGIEPGLLRGLRRIRARGRVEDEEADLVLRNVDRAVESDRNALIRQLLGRRAGPPLARAALSGAAAGENTFRRGSSARRSTLGLRPSPGNVGTPELCSAQRARQLRTRADAELRVDVREVRLDRALTEEERRGHLAIRPAFGDERRDALLRRSQPVLARATPDAAELGARLLDPGRRPELLEAGERRLDRLACRPLLPRPAPDDPEREQRSRSAEEIADLLVLRNRPLQELERRARRSPGRQRRDRGSASPARAPAHGRSRTASASQTSRTRIASSIRPSSRSVSA